MGPCKRTPAVAPAINQYTVSRYSFVVTEFQALGGQYSKHGTQMLSIHGALLSCMIVVYAQYPTTYISEYS